MKLILPAVFVLLLSCAVLAAEITVSPDADISTDTWTSTPLFSKVSENAVAPDGTVITSPLNPSAANFINFSLSETSEDITDRVNIILHARRSSAGGSASLNISWFNQTGGLISSIDTGALANSLTFYTGAFSVLLNKSNVNTSHVIVIPNSIIGAPRIEIDTINLNLTTRNTTIKANGTITGPVYLMTGNYTEFNGSCEITGLESDVQIILQNSTDNVTFTKITTDSSQPIFANASNYSIGALMNANSSVFSFIVNATKHGNYTLRAQCNATDSAGRWMESNGSAANFSANQTYGFLNVSILTPSPDVITSNVAQNLTFILAANVSCSGANPTAVCAEINGTARYNYSAADPLEQVNFTPGEFPLWSGGNQTCGFLNYSNVCSLTWYVNATGVIGTTYALDVDFFSNASQVLRNNTLNSNVTITDCIVDLEILWTYIDFGLQTPNTFENPALGNSANVYNVSSKRGSCNADFYIKGTNLTNSSFTTYIGTGNVTWSNVSNTYSSSVNLSDVYNVIELNVAALTNVTTWYWMNVPPVYAGIYNGTITITGVKNGEFL